METTLLLEMLRAIWRELVLWRNWVFGTFVAVSFVVLGVGLKWPEYYQTHALLFAETSNIIKPLLEGRAELTEIDRSKEAREQIYTRDVLTRVAKGAGLITATTELEEQDKVIRLLRERITVKNEGNEYFRIFYIDRDPDKSFEILNAVVDTFIKDSVASRREESRSAFEFIDQQVDAYKRQLVLAENKLKEFQSKNYDGSAASVASRVDDLRTQIEEYKLVIGETTAKKKTIEQQLAAESKHREASDKLDTQQKRLDALVSQLDLLRLSYQETYPDIVALKEQIESQKLVIEALKEDGYAPATGDNVENPLYEQLRDRLAQTEADLLSQKRRQESMQNMLAEEYKRAERVASRQADLAELTRDYNVTKQIYEEMLERKEKARLSMTLDIEGQGVNYKIQEPAVFPLRPSGIRFLHFAILSPVVGLIVAMGLIVAYVILDPRLRSPIILQSKLPREIELLTTIPHFNTPLSRRVLRSDMVLLTVAFVLLLAAYVAVVYSRMEGLL